MRESRPVSHTKHTQVGMRACLSNRHYIHGNGTQRRRCNREQYYFWNGTHCYVLCTHYNFWNPLQFPLVTVHTPIPGIIPWLFPCGKIVDIDGSNRLTMGSYANTNNRASNRPRNSITTPRNTATVKTRPTRCGRPLKTFRNPRSECLHIYTCIYTSKKSVFVRCALPFLSSPVSLLLMHATSLPLSLSLARAHAMPSCAFLLSCPALLLFLFTPSTCLPP